MYFGGSGRRARACSLAATFCQTVLAPLVRLLSSVAECQRLTLVLLLKQMLGLTFLPLPEIGAGSDFFKASLLPLLVIYVSCV